MHSLKILLYYVHVGRNIRDFVDSKMLIQRQTSEHRGTQQLRKLYVLSFVKFADRHCEAVIAPNFSTYC